MNEILPILLFLSTEGLWFQRTTPKTWVEWKMTGALDSSFRRETVGEHSWAFVHQDMRYDIALSVDHQEIASFTMTDSGGNTSSVEKSAWMWYVPQKRIEKQMVALEKPCQSPLGMTSCSRAEHTDGEGNYFQWFGAEGIPGKVFQFEASFAGEPRRIIHFSMQGFGSLE